MGWWWDWDRGCVDRIGACAYLPPRIHWLIVDTPLSTIRTHVYNVRQAGWAVSLALLFIGIPLVGTTVQVCCVMFCAGFVCLCLCVVWCFSFLGGV